MLIRDTVQGGQPTMWQMWTLSEGLDAPGADFTPAGQQILPARRLEGDRFTARGQFGVHMEYFVASPTDTPRHTLRWGTTYEPHRSSWHPLSMLRDNYAEYRDLLHLQLPGDGAYFVAFYPRLPQEEAPCFSTWGEGKAIMVSGAWGTDYGFLSAVPETAAADGAAFCGTAGSVQVRATGIVLSLAASGEVQYQDYGLSADFPVSLHVAEGDLTVELPALGPGVAFAGGAVSVTAPGAWALAEALPGAALTTSEAGYRLEIPPGLERVRLIRSDR